MSLETQLKERYSLAHARLYKPKFLPAEKPPQPDCSAAVPDLSPQSTPVDSPEWKVTLREMANYIAVAENIPLSELKGRCRTARIATIRQVFYYLAKRYCHVGVTAIGRFIGRDHTTVAHGVKHIDAMMLRMPWWQDHIRNHCTEIERKFPRLIHRICPWCGSDLIVDKKRADSCESAQSDV